MNSLDPAVLREIARAYPALQHYYYVHSKLKTDPLYDGVYDFIKNSRFPLLDIGCGMGVFSFYLHKRNYQNQILGTDYDAPKIKVASEVAAESFPDANVSFQAGDARESLPDFSGNVVILDILQFFEPEEQKALLVKAIERIPPGGLLCIRTGLREKSLRFFVTWLGDLFAKITFWMKAAPVYYPTREFLQSFLEEQGLEGDIEPLWGNTPFNNYLVKFRRPETQEV